MTSPAVLKLRCSWRWSSRKERRSGTVPPGCWSSPGTSQKNLTPVIAQEKNNQGIHPLEILEYQILWVDLSVVFWEILILFNSTGDGSWPTNIGRRQACIQSFGHSLRHVKKAFSLPSPPNIIFKGTPSSPALIHGQDDSNCTF